jgi:hypothetical protein
MVGLRRFIPCVEVVALWSGWRACYHGNAESETARCRPGRRRLRWRRQWHTMVVALWGDLANSQRHYGRGRVRRRLLRVVYGVWAQTTATMLFCAARQARIERLEALEGTQALYTEFWGTVEVWILGSSERCRSASLEWARRSDQPVARRLASPWCAGISQRSGQCKSMQAAKEIESNDKNGGIRSTT